MAMRDEGGAGTVEIGTAVEDALTFSVIGAAIAVHRAMGPGLLESIYQACLVHELRRRQIPFACGVSVPLVYEGQQLENRLRLDVLVDNALILELKSVDALAPIHRMQLLTYLRLTGHRRGLLINFNVLRLTEGVIRLAL
jgi:GxxExxY protein